MSTSAFSLTYPGTDQRLRIRSDPGGASRLIAEPGMVEFGQISEGIWDLTRPADRDRHSSFATAYTAVREAEGRTMTPDTVRSLPYIDRDEPLADMWAQRAKSFERLQSVLRTREPGCLLDVGAGCGWLAARCAADGWRTAAVDISVDGPDGLVAARHHPHEILLARADMAALPFATASIDVVVCNASLHYAGSIEAVLDEVSRVTGGGGMIAILDSPVYTDPAAGRLMVNEFADQVVNQHGLAPAAFAGPGFVLDEQLTRFAQREGAAWVEQGVTGPKSRMLERAHRWRGARRAGREIARRPTLTMDKPETSEPRATTVHADQINEATR